MCDFMLFDDVFGRKYWDWKRPHTRWLVCGHLLSQPLLSVILWSLYLARYNIDILSDYSR
jgi:hypothetical protein